jgi:hypothetical protein
MLLDDFVNLSWGVISFVGLALGYEHFKDTKAKVWF